MLLLRSLAMLVAVSIIVLAGLAVITGKPRYRRLALHLGSGFVVLAVVFGLGVMVSAYVG